MAKRYPGDDNDYHNSVVKNDYENPFNPRREKIRRLRALLSLATSTDRMRTIAMRMSELGASREVTEALFTAATRIDDALENIETPIIL